MKDSGKKEFKLQALHKGGGGESIHASVNCGTLVVNWTDLATLFLAMNIFVLVHAGAAPTPITHFSLAHFCIGLVLGSEADSIEPS